MTIKKRIREINRIGWFVSAAFFAMSATVLFVETQLPRSLLASMLFVGTGIGVVMAAGMFCPNWHPVLRGLAAYGVPTQVAVEIDSELEQAGSVSVFGQVAKAFRINNSKKFPVFLSPSWLVQFRELGIRVVRLNGVMRYYKKTLTIEAATIVADQWFSVVVVEHCGREVEFHQSEKEVDRLMAALAILLPHIPNGSDLNQALSRFFRD